MKYRVMSKTNSISGYKIAMEWWRVPIPEQIPISRRLTRTLVWTRFSRHIDTNEGERK